MAQCRRRKGHVQPGSSCFYTMRLSTFCTAALRHIDFWCFVATVCICKVMQRRNSLIGEESRAERVQSSCAFSHHTFFRGRPIPRTQKAHTGHPETHLFVSCFKEIASLHQGETISGNVGAGSPNSPFPSFWGPDQTSTQCVRKDASEEK